MGRRKKLELKACPDFTTAAINAATDKASFAELPAKLVDPKNVWTSRVLGEGTFAVVRRGLVKDPVLGSKKSVAVKQLKRAEDAERFIREAMLLSKISHRHIVQHEGIGVVYNDAAPVMFQLQEFVRGGTLEDLFLERSPLVLRPHAYSFPVALRWAIQVAEGVQYMHTSTTPVVHRDLKAANVLITDPNPCLASVKIADLGLAAELDPQASVSSNGASASMDAADPFSSVSDSPRQLTARTGSYVYMAPEVYLGQEYDEKADIYSLGVLFLEMFTGKLLSDMVLKIRSYDNAKRFACCVANGFPLACPQSFPRDIAELLQACWSRKAEQRPSASQVISMLESIRAANLEREDLLDAVELSISQRLRLGCFNIGGSIRQRIGLARNRAYLR
ncbi:hypothetical protein BSKO_02269 [Bryopsis sp. KO-2023]|nr:hypothetical protein BSKO_02269 [Bryopsis sp. KO-2023]